MTVNGELASPSVALSVLALEMLSCSGTVTDDGAGEVSVVPPGLVAVAVPVSLTEPASMSAGSSCRCRCRCDPPGADRVAGQLTPLPWLSVTPIPLRVGSRCW